MNNTIWMTLVSVLVGLGRLTVPGHDLSYAGTYEALAHIWVGVLFTLATQQAIAAAKPSLDGTQWSTTRTGRFCRAFFFGQAGRYLCMLTAFETAKFLAR
jgi:hypothetical protein